MEWYGCGSGCGGCGGGCGGCAGGEGYGPCWGSYPGDWSGGGWCGGDGFGCSAPSGQYSSGQYCRPGPYDAAACGAAAGGKGAAPGWDGAGACPGAGPGWGTSSGDPEKDALVGQVKQIQRSSTEGRAQWEKYSDAMRTGSRDPNRHAVESLRTFLTAYHQGVPPEVVAAKAGGGRVLRLRGVPFQCGVLDVVRFLAEYGVTEAGVVLGRRADGRVTGEAFVQFRSGALAEQALDEKQKQEIQGRYIELFRSSMEEWNEAAHSSPAGKASTGDLDKDRLVCRVKEIQRSGQEAKEQWYRFCDATRTGNRDPVRHTAESLRSFLDAFEHGEAPEVPAAARASTVLRLRGVPFQSDVPDVVNFLAEYGVTEQQVALARSAEGRKTGEAYVVFATPELADRAMEEKQRQEIRGRYIELFRSSFEERDQAVAQAGASLFAASGLSSGWGMPGDMGHAGFSEKDELVAKVKSIQRSGTEGREQWEKYCDAVRTGNRDPALHSVESMRSFLEAFARGESPEVPAAKAIGGSPVLRLRGVPFQSDILDVVEFLAEYGVDKTQVALGRGPDGRVTGEAYVVFRSVELAERALDEKQHQEIRGRYIELFRSSFEEKDQNTSAAPSGFVSTGDREKDELVARVKQIQRSRQDGKEKWEEYCTMMRTGNRDPIRHSVESIRNFVDAYDRGETPKVLAGAGGPVLRLRGVPFQSDIPDVVEFLAAYEVDRASVALGRGPDGRKTGEAFVVFKTTELAERALEEKQKQEIMGRYIELFRSSYEERTTNCGLPLTLGSGGDQALAICGAPGEKDDFVAQVKAIQRSGQEGREQWERYCDAMRTGNRDPLKHTVESMRNFLEAYRRGEAPEVLAARAVGVSRVVRLRGVPFQSDLLDVEQFLAEYGVDRTQVTLGRGPDGRMTGEAYVVFPTAELAEKAMDEKQHQEIRGRYIELFRSSFEERDEHSAAGVASATGGALAAAMLLPPHCPALRLRGLPYDCRASDVVEFLSEYFVDTSQVVMGMGSDGKPNGEAFVACSTPELAQFILKEKHMQKLKSRYVEIFESSYEELMEAARSQSRISKPASWPGGDGSFAGAWGPKGGAFGKGCGWGSPCQGMGGCWGKGGGECCKGGYFGKPGAFGASCSKGGDYGSYGPMCGPYGKGGCTPMDGPYGGKGWSKPCSNDDGYGSAASAYGMYGKAGGASSSKGYGAMGEAYGKGGAYGADYGCMDGKEGPYGKGGPGGACGCPAAYWCGKGGCFDDGSYGKCGKGKGDMCGPMGAKGGQAFGDSCGAGAFADPAGAGMPGVGMQGCWDGGTRGSWEVSSKGAWDAGSKGAWDAGSKGTWDAGSKGSGGWPGPCGSDLQGGACGPGKGWGPSGDMHGGACGQGKGWGPSGDMQGGACGQGKGWGPCAGW